jgi:hypothetical protein
MNIHTTTETIYNNGQKVGYRRALQDFVDSFYEECRIYGPNDKFNKTKFLNIVDKIKDTLEVKNESIL